MELEFYRSVIRILRARIFGRRKKNKKGCLFKAGKEAFPSISGKEVSSSKFTRSFFAHSIFYLTFVKGSNG